MVAALGPASKTATAMKCLALAMAMTRTRASSRSVMATTHPTLAAPPLAKAAAEATTSRPVAGLALRTVAGRPAAAPR